jgi:hypothetical protein
VLAALKRKGEKNMSNSLIVKAIKQLRPGAAFSLNGDTFDGLVWLDENTQPPSEKEVAAKTVEIVEYEARVLPILADIGNIESQITQRRIREAVLGIDGGWLEVKNAEIQKLREQL